MSKMPFSNKCQILGEMWLYYREDAANNKNWSEFFAWADVALPLSYTIWQGIAVLNEDEKDGERFINEAYDTFCNMISIDNEAVYDSLGDAFAASPNGPIQDA